MTRIAISAESEAGLESRVSSHFGRCPYFALVDVEGTEVRQVECVANPFFGQHEPGAVPQFIQEQGAKVMLTGGMGQRAIGFFGQAGIQAVTGASGTVRSALEAYVGGELQGASSCAESKAHGHD